MKYKESQNVGNKYRITYREDINSFISRLCEQKKEESVKNAARFLTSHAEMRASLEKALGWPLTEYDGEDVQVTKEKVAEENGITLYRMTFHVFSKIRFYGLLFRHNGNGKRPLVISQHGGLGTPELCSSLLETGSANYNDMSERILSLGADVFAPQMLIWDPKQYDESVETINRKEIDLQLKQCGSSVAALEIYCLRKCLDYFCKMPSVDVDKIGMVVLSYGGFYTLYTAALDTRIKAALSCSFFNDRGEYPRSDWVWNPGKDFFFDPEVAMLVYPRALCIAVGENDELFNIDSANNEIERLEKMSDLAYKSTDWLKIFRFNGTHEFITTNDALEWFKIKLRTGC